MSLFTKKKVFLYEEDLPDKDKKRKKKKEATPMAAEAATSSSEESPLQYEAVETIDPEIPLSENSTPNITPAKDVSDDKKKKKPKKQKKEKPPKAEKRQFPLSKRGIIGAVCIFFALLVAFVLSPYVTRITNETMGSVIRATVDISKGSLLEDSSFTVESIPEKAIPKNALGSLDQLRGQYAAVEITAGDTMLDTKVSPDIPFADAYLYTLPQGKQAMSVRIRNMENGLSGKLVQSDVVSVYASVETADKENYLAVAPPELRYVSVLSVTTETGANYDKNDSAEGQAEELPVTVELLVSDRQAQALAGLNQGGSIHLSLVTRGDPEYATTLLQLQEETLVALIQKEEKEAGQEPSTEDQSLPVTTETEGQAIE
ncbi:Flp pilus assembly protein CpaB (plasmid) [Oscillospiraceae bacterium MB08-C2-2]|nr:Flp pilus assembly protein CpaB [Oscillospiraceae bacterium MB08-C2-2]